MSCNSPHLNMARQSYLEHMKDAWTYAFMSLCASVSFFVHGVIPDAFPQAGSNMIRKVHTTIDKKYQELRTRNTTDVPIDVPTDAESTGTSTATLIDGVRVNRNTRNLNDPFANVQS